MTIEQLPGTGLAPQHGHEDHGLVWVGSTLATTRRPDLDKARKPVLSASTANRILECPAKHLAETVLPDQKGPLDPAPLGNAIHDVLEDLYSLPRNSRTVSLVPALTAVHEPDYAATLEGPQLQRWRTLVTAGARGAFDLEDPTTVDAVALEAEIRNVEIAPGLRFRGYVDRIRRTNSGAIAVDDWKSGKFKTPGRFGDNYGDQARAYSIAIEAMTGHPVVEAMLLYPVAKRRREIDLSPQARAATIRRYQSARDLLDASYESGRYETRPGPLCGWCPLANACPVATIRTDKARAVADEQPDVHIPEQAGDYDLVAGLPTQPTAELRNPSDTGGESKELTMTITMPAIQPAMPQPENRPYEEYVGNDLNLASYAAGAVASVMAYAVKYVDQASAHPWLQDRSVMAVREALAATIATVIFRAQSRHGGSTSWQSATNKHVRMFVYDAFNRKPFPFGDEQAIANYLAGVENYAVAAMDTARGLYERTTTDYDQSALAALTH